MQWVASHFLNNQFVEKMLICIRKIFGMHQAKKTSKIGLRAVQCIIKNWKDSGEPSPLRKECGREKKVLNDCDGRSLKHLVELSRKKQQ